MITIENEYLKIRIHPTGAELNSLFNKRTSLEYLWNADPAYWSKKSPVLFPIVGGLKQDCYYYEGKAYKMGRHGFAREMDFGVTGQQHDSVTFTLNSSTITKEKYPFDFQLDITYTIHENQLQVTYLV